MRKRIMLLALLLMCVLLFSACGKMSDEEAIAAMRESDELWITHGLAAWESGTEAENIAPLFEDGRTIWYLYLHNYMFIYDEENSKLAAEQFFRYVAENHGLAAILDTDKRVAYKTEYLRSLGFDFDYPKSAEEETFFRNITFHSDDRYDYIFTHDRASFTFTDLKYVRPAKIQSMIYDTCVFLDGFAKKVKKENLSPYFDTERRVVFHCEDIGRISGVSHANTSGYIYMTSGSSLTHEYVHAVSNFSAGTTGANRMLSEVIADYFAKMDGINGMFLKHYHELFTTIASGYYDGYLDKDGSAAEQGKYLISLFQNYVAIGGKYETPEDIDFYLEAQAGAMTAQTSGSSMCRLLIETLGSINGELEPFDGGDLYGDELGSFGTWLIDEFGLDAVLETWRTDDFSGTLGKDYQTLKAEWQKFVDPYIKKAYK